jgi:hypothetical protein
MKKLSSAWARGWFGTAVAMSALCLVITFFERALEAGGAPRLLRSFSLRGEMGIGAWWSGMLLLLAAAHAADGYFFRRKSAPRLAYAWAGLSFILVCLSADEVASLHERVGDFGGWLALAPFGAVLGGVWFFAMSALWRYPEERSNAGWSAVAFCLIGSVAGQEFLENNTQWWGEQAALRVLVEEGTEVIALLILLRVGMSQSGGGFQSSPHAARPVFQALESWRIPIIAATLVASAPVAALTVALMNRIHGLPVLWLVASSFFLAALLLVRESLTRAWTRSYIALIGLCVALSAAAVALSPAALPRRSHLFTSAGLLSIWYLWLVTSNPRNRERLSLLAAFGAAMLALTWVERASLTLTFTAYAIAGASVLYAHAFLGTGEREGAASIGSAHSELMSDARPSQG